MKVGLTLPVPSRGGKPAAALAAVGALLLAVLVSACTGGGSPAPTVISPGATARVTATPGASAASGGPAPSGSVTTARVPRSPGTGTESGGAAAPGASSPAATATPPGTTAPTATAFPTAAPETGGGGTAGTQNGMLFAIGGAAILAGIASLAYRRRPGRPRPRRGR